MDHDVSQEDQAPPDWSLSNMPGNLFDDLLDEDMPSFTAPLDLSANLNMPATASRQTSDMQMTSTADQLPFRLPTMLATDQQPYGMLSSLVNASLLTFSDMAMPQQNVMAPFDPMLDPHLFDMPDGQTSDTNTLQLAAAEDRLNEPLPSHRNQAMELNEVQAQPQSNGLISLPTQQQMQRNQQVHPAQQLSSINHQLSMGSPTNLDQHPSDQYTYHYFHAPGESQFQMAETAEQHDQNEQSATQPQPQQPEQQLRAQATPSNRQSRAVENRAQRVSQPNQQTEDWIRQQSSFTCMPARAESGSEPALPSPYALGFSQSQMPPPTYQNPSQAQPLNRMMMPPLPYPQFDMIGSRLAGHLPTWHQEQVTGLAAVHGPQDVVNRDDGRRKKDHRQHVHGVNTVATVQQTSNPQSATAHLDASTIGSGQYTYPRSDQGNNNSSYLQQRTGHEAGIAANRFDQPRRSRKLSSDHEFRPSTRPQNTSNLALPPASAASNNPQISVVGATQQPSQQQGFASSSYPQFRTYQSYPPQAPPSAAHEDRRDSTELSAAQAPASQPAGKVPIPRAPPRMTEPSAVANPANPQTSGPSIAAAMGPTSQEHTIPPRPKPGRKPMPADKATDRRRSQNRLAQRNFRDKRTQKVEELKTEVNYLKEQLRSVQATLVQSQEQGRIEVAGLQAQLQESQQAHQGTLSELRRWEEGSHRSERDQRRSGRRSASPKHSDESSQTYPPHNYEKLKLPSITNHNSDISVMTPPEDNEIDMTEVWMRSRPANHQQNNWTDFNADADPVSNDSCGFCTDGGFCACKSAPPLPATTEKRKISPGTCDMCQRDPKRAEACRSLNYEQDKAVESAPKTMSCGQFIDKFSQAKGRMPGITELFGPMRSFPAVNGGFNIDEREAARVLSGLSQHTP